MIVVGLHREPCRLILNELVDLAEFPEALRQTFVVNNDYISNGNIGVGCTAAIGMSVSISQFEKVLISPSGPEVV